MLNPYNLTLRIPKDSALTLQELDNNFRRFEFITSGISETIVSGGTGGGTTNNYFYSGATDIVYSDLIPLINLSGLTAGQFYRITDYQTIYDQPDYLSNGDPKSTVLTLSGSVSPIIVLATSISTISVDAYQPEYPFDTIRYVGNQDITEINLAPAKGLIVERIDSDNNRTGYDHREILFKRYETVSGSGIYNSYKDTGFAYQPFKTFQDGIAANNFLGGFCAVDYAVAGLNFVLPNVVFQGIALDNKIDYLCVNNTIGNNCRNNTIGTHFSGNTIGSGFTNNIIGAEFYNNTIGNIFTGNIVGARFYDNVLGDTFERNTFGSSTHDNIMGSTCRNNLVGSNFYDNTIAGSFSQNSIGGNMRSNDLGTSVLDNIMASGFNANTLPNTVWDNQFGSSFEGNVFTNSLVGNKFGDNMQNNTFGQSWYNNVTHIKNSVFGGFMNNVMYIDGNQIQNNTFTTFTDNQIYSSFSGNTGSVFINNLIMADFKNNILTGGTFHYNTIKPGTAILNVNFAGATHVFNSYSCDIFINATGGTRLSYIDSGDAMVITNITT